MKERERRRKGNVTDIKGIQIDRQIDGKREQRKENHKEKDNVCMLQTEKERDRKIT